MIKVGPFWSNLLKEWGHCLEASGHKTARWRILVHGVQPFDSPNLLGSFLETSPQNEKRTIDWCNRPTYIGGNISCWWHIMLHLHPGRLAWNLREENLEEENHLNQTIICLFNVNLRVFFVLLDFCLFHSLQFGSNWCQRRWLGDTSSRVEHFGHFNLCDHVNVQCCFVVSD